MSVRGWNARLSGVELKIDRAEKHLAALDEALEWFNKDVANELVTEKDADSGWYFLKTLDVPSPPDDLGILIGDCLHNARSALDHLAWQLVNFPTSQGPDPEPAEDRIEFPIFLCERKYRDVWRNKIGGIDPKGLTVLENLQPWAIPDEEKRPTHPLWLLYELSNWDKHRVLHTTANQLRHSGFLNPELLKEAETLPPGELKSNTPLARVCMKDGGEPNMKMGFYLALDVAFDQGLASGLPVSKTMELICKTVEHVVTRLEPFVT